MALRTIWSRFKADPTMTDQEPATPPDQDESSQDDARSSPADTVNDLARRIEELETVHESTENEIRSLRDGQEAVTDDIEDVQETMRQLLGIYEQVTDQANPFRDQPQEVDGFQFGVLSGDGEPAATDGGESDSGDSVGLADLRAEPTPEESGSSSESDGPARENALEAAEADEASPGEPAESPQSTPPFIDGWTRGGDRHDDPTPVGFTDTYATDILAFEWLSYLIEASSPAAAINAVSYYNEIGWISDVAESYLLDLLSGPHLDVGIDPREPESLTAADHAESYAYIRKLAAIQDLNGPRR